MHSTAARWVLRYAPELSKRIRRMRAGVLIDDRWLLGPPDWTMPVCEIDLKVGGAYRYVWRKTGVKDMGMGGVFREIVSPERLAATERLDES